MIKGTGPVYARKLVQAFGEAVFDTIEQNPERVQEVAGIGPRRAERIEVVALAFDRYPEGGDGWNVRNDVAAWQVVLDAAVPVTTASGYVALGYAQVAPDHLN